LRCNAHSERTKHFPDFFEIVPWRVQAGQAHREANGPVIVTKELIEQLSDLPLGMAAAKLVGCMPKYPNLRIFRGVG
jgi:hypothetical protein